MPRLLPYASSDRRNLWRTLWNLLSTINRLDLCGVQTAKDAYEKYIIKHYPP